MKFLNEKLNTKLMKTAKPCFKFSLRVFSTLIMSIALTNSAIGATDYEFNGQINGLKGTSSLSMNDIPSIPVGIYKTGFNSLTNITLSNGSIVSAAVWYPVAANTTDNLLTEYQTFSTFPVVSGVYGVKAKENVYENAPIISGKHPIIYFLQGDLRDPDVGRFFMAQNGEKLASHGFIYVTFNRNNSRNISEAKAFIEYMENDSPFATSIDKEKTGIEAQSGGGFNGTEIASQNPNIKGFLSSDGASSDYVPNIPMMRLGTRYIGLTGQEQDLFNKSTGRPLIFVTWPRFFHLGFYNNFCESIRALRTLAINEVSDPNYEPLINPGNNPNGIDANALWKIPFGAIKGGADTCSTASWEPAVPNAAFDPSFGKYLNSDIQTKFSILYRVAFWRKIFFDDTSFDNTLFNPAWVNQNYDPNLMRIEVKK